MNTKEDKIQLLRAIATNQIKIENIPNDPLIVSSKSEMFLGLMMDASQMEGTGNVIYIGEAKKALDELFRVE